MKVETNFESYSFGVTASSVYPPYGPTVNEAGNKYIFTDSISGATFEYITNDGETGEDVVLGIIAEWQSQNTEPWNKFNVFPYPIRVPNEPDPNPGYDSLYAVQFDSVGPTGGAPVNIALTTAQGPTSNALPGSNNINYGFSGVLEFFKNAYMGYFDSYNTPVNELNDYPCAPIAAPFVLTNCSFELDWNEAAVTWNNVDYKSVGNTGPINYSTFNYSYTNGPTALINGNSYPLGTTNPYSGSTALGPFPGLAPGTTLHPPGPTYNTGFAGTTGPTYNPVLYDWINIGYRNFFEMEWIITYDQDPTWKIESGLLALEDGKDYPILLPYVGTYTIEMILYDTFGGQSKITETSKLRSEERV